MRSYKNAACWFSPRREPRRLWILAHAGVKVRGVSFLFFAAAEPALARMLSLAASKMRQPWVRRSSKAVVILASPTAIAHSLKLKLVVITAPERS